MDQRRPPTTVIVPVYKCGVEPVRTVVQELIDSGCCDVVVDHLGLGIAEHDDVRVLGKPLLEEPFQLADRLKLAADLLEAAGQVKARQAVVVTPLFLPPYEWLFAGVVAEMADQMLLCLDDHDRVERYAAELFRRASGTVVVVRPRPSSPLALEAEATAVIRTEEVTVLPFLLGEEVGDSLALAAKHDDALEARHRVLAARLLALPPGAPAHELLRLLAGSAQLLERLPGWLPRSDVVAGVVERLPDDLDGLDRTGLRDVAVRLTRLGHPQAYRLVERLS